jgi:hypothetical protein
MKILASLSSNSATRISKLLACSSLISDILPRIIKFISIYGVLRLQRKEATAMTNLRFSDIQSLSTEVLEPISLILDEFQRLVLLFEAAFSEQLAE